MCRTHIVHKCHLDGVSDLRPDHGSEEAQMLVLCCPLSEGVVSIAHISRFPIFATNPFIAFFEEQCRGAAKITVVLMVKNKIIK